MLSVLIFNWAGEKLKYCKATLSNSDLLNKAASLDTSLSEIRDQGGSARRNAGKVIGAHARRRAINSNGVHV